MKSYVVGFLFDQKAEFVVLIKKNKPEWQRGLLNGVGGKIEAGETPDQAMSREFREEAGVDIQAINWRLFCLLKGGTAKVCKACLGGTEVFLGAPRPCQDCDGTGILDTRVEVYCFTTRRPANVRSMTDETVSWYNIAVINDGTTIPNLAWLVPMALDPNNPELMAVVENVAR